MSREREGMSPAMAAGMGAGAGVLVIGCLILLPVVVGIVGIVAAIAIPNFVVMQYRAKRAEVPANIDGIKTAELAYDAAFDEFIAVHEPMPRPALWLDGEPAPWESGSAFDTLGWSPDGPVRGTYWVELRDGGTDFVVHGMIDVDGDGDPAHYTATKSINTVQVTHNATY